MKKNLLILALTFLMFSCSSQNSNNETMEQKLPTIGMDFSQFSSDYPNIVKDKTDGNKQYNIEDTIQSINGGWAYNFAENKLQWIMFNSYSDEISQENFDNYSSAAQQVIEDYKSKYGEPTEFEFENKTFKDPYTERHYGYDVISAIWRTDEMDFKIEFTFMGGKGEYNFLFKMEFHEHGYEYF
jgi:hypothetical protein